MPIKVLKTKKKVFIPLKPSEPYRTVSTEMTAVTNQLVNMTDVAVNMMWLEKVGTNMDFINQPRWFLEIGLKYWALLKGYKRKGEKPSDKVKRRFSLCKRLKRYELEKESYFLREMGDCYRKGDREMAKIKKGVKPIKRITPISILIPIFELKVMKSDDDIIKKVHEKTGNVKFNKAQLVWYRHKYKLGKLRGMDGESHDIKRYWKPRVVLKKIFLKKKMFL